MRIRHMIFRLLLLGLSLALLLSCASQPAPPTPTPRLAPTSTPTPEPTSVPTPIPLREMTICQAEEPDTLYVYGTPSRGASNVLQAIYDGPIDVRSYEFYPVILDAIPSLDNGQVSLMDVQVAEDDPVIDTMGRSTTLRAGNVVVRTTQGEEVLYEGETITMTRMVVTYTLKAGVTWADGEPVTAYDSRYAYELSATAGNPTLTRLRDTTASYEVVDERRLVWSSLPGYQDPFFFLNFYHPLPHHIWGNTEAAQLAASEVVQRRPLGWGPFVVEEWVEGESIRLVRNPNYFRADEELPYLDRVTFRFVTDLDEALDLLLAGGCDLITQDVFERSVIESGDLVPLLEAAGRGEVQLITAPSTEWAHLDFGIQSAEWYRRPAFFDDIRVRHAVAMCIHRERIAGEVFPYGPATIADSYVAEEHPLHAGGSLHRWEYNPSQALALLHEVGWRDEDGDGLREAHQVAGSREGTPCSVTLLTTADHLPHERAARIIEENLAACGIGLSVEFLSDGEFYADGPHGPIFGRQFDLALFSWLNDFGGQCELYLSSAVPGPENLWATTNNPGYTSEEYDAACAAARSALYGTEAYGRHHVEAQRILSYDLPILPLYFAPRDPTAYFSTWNIEAFRVLPQGGE